MKLVVGSKWRARAPQERSCAIAPRGADRVAHENGTEERTASASSSAKTAMPVSERRQGLRAGPPIPPGASDDYGPRRPGR